MRDQREKAAKRLFQKIPYDNLSGVLFQNAMLFDFTKPIFSDVRAVLMRPAAIVAFQLVVTKDESRIEAWRIANLTLTRTQSRAMMEPRALQQHRRRRPIASRQQPPCV